MTPRSLLLYAQEIRVDSVCGRSQVHTHVSQMLHVTDSHSQHVLAFTGVHTHVTDTVLQRSALHTCAHSSVSGVLYVTKTHLAFFTDEVLQRMKATEQQDSGDLN